MLDVTLIPHDVKELATKYANVTKTIQTDLQSGIATDIAAMFPGGTQLQKDLIAVTGRAVTALNAVAGLAGNNAGSAILQRLGADLTQIEHASTKHTISFYITSFELVFHDLFGSTQTPITAAIPA